MLTLNPPAFKSKQAATAISLAPPMSQSNYPGSIDPSLLRVGREMYGLYCQLHPDRRGKQPIGVAVNKKSYRSKLIFSSFPVLLPEECFISVQELDN